MVWHFVRQVKQSGHTVKNSAATQCEGTGIHHSGAHYVITRDQLQVKSTRMEHSYIPCLLHFHWLTTEL